MTTLLLTGATGTIGRRLVRTLTAQGHRPAVLTRDPDRLAALGADRSLVMPVLVDHAGPTHLRATFEGVERLFLVSPNTPQQVEHERAVIDAAAEAGVSRLVKISAHGADAGSPVAFWRWHAAIEEHLMRSGIPHVSLRPRFSMANVLGHAEGVRHGVLFTPAVDAPVAMVDPQDVAELAAHLLLAAELPRRRVLDVSGPCGVTFAALAAALGELTGRPVTYRGGTDEEATAYLEQRGTPPFVVEQLLAIFAALRSGAQAQPVGTIAEMLGRQPRTVTTFLDEHAEAFRARALTGDLR